MFDRNDYHFHRVCIRVMFVCDSCELRTVIRDLEDMIQYYFKIETSFKVCFFRNFSYTTYTNNKPKRG